MALPPDPQQPALLLDVRDESAFFAAHHPEAANIPLAELAARVHELPQRWRPLAVFHEDPVSARWACSRLRARGYERVTPERSRAGQANWISGPARVRLWRPHELLEMACDLIESTRTSTLENRANDLPLRALDLACGAGRDAVYLALRGWRVEAWDLLPDALARAADLAWRNGVNIVTRCIDLERRDAWPADAAFDLVIVFNYLHRPLFDAIRRAVRPGGWIVYETFVDPQRERFGKPRRPEHVLRPGELRAAFAGWDIRVYREQLTTPRRIAAGLVARKGGALPPVRGH